MGRVGRLLFVLGTLQEHFLALGVEVCLYSDSNYGGAAYCRTASERQFSPFSTWNDAPSSVSVSEGASAVLYWDVGYRSTRLVVTKDIPSLARFGFDNAASSWTIVATDDMHHAACFYYHSDFKGERICVNPGTFNSMPPGWDGQVSSVKLAAGFKAQLFDAVGLGGNSSTLLSSSAELGPQSFNDATRSFLVSRISSACSLSADCSYLPLASVTRVTDRNGKPPRKGDDLMVDIRVQGASGVQSLVKVTPYLTSKRFTDYEKVALPAVFVDVNSADRLVSVIVGTFIFDSRTYKRYAVGAGPYEIFATVERADGISEMSSLPLSFTVGDSDAVLPAVVYDDAYFASVTGGYNPRPSTYIKEVFTRPVQQYDPSTGAYETYRRGFDQMLGIQHLSSPVPGFSVDRLSGYCEQAAAYVTKALGLAADWSGAVGTNTDHHGFDYVVALSPDVPGGVACGWLNVQVSGFINRDVKRQQSIVQHESGHIFGAPHCDQQGYVMCSPSKHERYVEDGTFVWLESSKQQLTNPFD
ncbi:hypothetical protein DIPPA_28438 [Diplonema papillatum]|nr:hypothetical protein DIPPA_28438 [Diplonema papillatum]